MIITKILSLIDRRVGKGTLQELSKSIESEHEIVRYFFKDRRDVAEIHGDGFLFPSFTGRGITKAMSNSGNLDVPTAQSLFRI